MKIKGLEAEIERQKMLRRELEEKHGLLIEMVRGWGEVGDEVRDRDKPAEDRGGQAVGARGVGE